VSAFRSRRARLHPERAYRARVPVVVVGNSLVGGTGKSPIVIALVQALKARGWTPGVISRGYGANLGARARLSIDGADARTLGDEPALIARQTDAPVAVHPQRARAIATLLERLPAVDVIISDDGLQHLGMARDLEIIVQDERGVGNGRLLPAGPLREPAYRLDRADWVITTLPASVRPPDAAHGLTVTLRPTHVVQLASATRQEWAAWRTRHAQAPCSALAAIGRPERFFSMLRASGITLGHTRALPDHDAFAGDPFGGLPEQPILITPKDAIKCEGRDDERLWVVHADPVFSDPEWFEQIDTRLRKIRSALDAR
jgi:tetraacyldisaccharide 4'-kinase